jgi:hypothetical protein
MRIFVTGANGWVGSAMETNAAHRRVYETTRATGTRHRDYRTRAHDGTAPTTISRGTPMRSARRS